MEVERITSYRSRVKADQRLSGDTQSHPCATTLCGTAAATTVAAVAEMTEDERQAGVAMHLLRVLVLQSRRTGRTRGTAAAVAVLSHRASSARHQPFHSHWDTSVAAAAAADGDAEAATLQVKATTQLATTYLTPMPNERSKWPDPKRRGADLLRNTALTSVVCHQNRNLGRFRELTRKLLLRFRCRCLCFRNEREQIIFTHNRPCRLTSVARSRRGWQREASCRNWRSAERDARRQRTRGGSADRHARRGTLGLLLKMMLLLLLLRQTSTRARR